MTAAYVVDASAMLAWLQEEPGAERIEGHLQEGVISTVNASEVFEKNLGSPQPNARLLRDLAEVGVTIEPFTVDDAELAATLRAQTRHLGLSLADRACIALGMRLNLPILTADRVWAQLQLGADIQVIR